VPHAFTSIPKTPKQEKNTFIMDRKYLLVCGVDLYKLDGVRVFNSALYAARPIIENKVNEILKPRPREKYEYTGLFKANVAFCNLYYLSFMEMELMMQIC
jgi:hypothetical protein